MVLDLFSLTILLVLGLPVFLLIMLLPTVLELKKPKDAGPRLIMADISGVTTFVWHAPHLVNIEVEEKSDFRMLPAIGKLLMVLPNLDA